MSSDLSLIEDYLPIEAISAEAVREKSTRKAHIATLHMWWARRPLVACRAAVYAALVPASQFVPENGPDNKKQSLGRANAAKFITNLCTYPGNQAVIKEAERHILEYHADRLTKETGKMVSRGDIEAGRAPRPKVLDMFAGGGAIPLEALRLGCEAYALDLNPVAHIIELCTLVYPQKYGKPDINLRGMTGPKNEKGSTTWGGLAEEVHYWGNLVLKRMKEAISDQYPMIPDPEAKPQKVVQDKQSVLFQELRGKQKLKTTDVLLTPVAYLWTRTVNCKNPNCNAAVPLVKQTWLIKKVGRYVALKIIAPKGSRQVRFEVVESVSDKGLGFDPASGSKRGNATCLFCGTVADINYVKDEGWQGNMGYQMMAIICGRSDQRGKIYLSSDYLPDLIPDKKSINKKIEVLCEQTSLSIPNEPIANLPDDSRANSLGITVRPYGFRTWGNLFMPRQMLLLLSLASTIREAERQMISIDLHKDHLMAILSYLGLLLNRLAGFGNSLCGWNYHEQAVANVFGRQAIPMVWDFAEVAPFADMSGGIEGGLRRIIDVIYSASLIERQGDVVRGSALNLNLPNESVDVIVTDPPYYDNVPYSDISDFFYAWLKRTIGHLYPEHFAALCTPKKQEAIADPHRHNGSKEKARQYYERMMKLSFMEAQRVLKPGGQMVIVYAHKTTLGWASLVDALRQSGFSIYEAWPLDTEYSGRLRSQNSAALASSIFLVARKRKINVGIGNYEDDVQPELVSIVRERVDTLWDMGITGADLVIAAVGAGLRAFTRYEKVEYANGEEVPAEKFLSEVEGVVLDTMMAKLFGASGGNVSAVDPASRFYVLWRFVYKTAEIEAGEAIVFTYSQHVELDGSKGLSVGKDALVEKKKAKYRIRDFIERGQNEKLGLPTDNGQPTPLIDILHRILWLIENSPRKLNEFLDEARPDRERLRVLAQTLAGAALSGKSEQETERLISTTPAEQAALGKLLANWRNLIESQLVAAEEGLFGKKGR